MFYLCVKSILWKKWYFPLEKGLSVVLARNVIMLQHIIQFLLYYLSSGGLREAKNKWKFLTFSSKSGRGCLHCTRGGRLQEVSNIVIWLRNFWYFGKLVAEERERKRVNWRFDCICVNFLFFSQMEKLIYQMQDEKSGVPIRTVKSFMSKIPSVFTGEENVVELCPPIKFI